MTCPRCNGLMILDDDYSEAQRVEMGRCLNCGHRGDDMSRGPWKRNSDGGGASAKAVETLPAVIEGGNLKPKSLHFEISRDPLAWGDFVATWRRTYTDYEFSSSEEPRRSDGNTIDVYLRLIEPEHDEG